MRPLRGAWTCLLLSLIGIGLSSYLAYLHLGLLRGELLGGAVCGSGAFNCHAVTAGAWGSFLGMPLALWGVLGYIVVLALSLLALQSPDWAARAMTALSLLAAGFVAIDALLLTVMAVVIRHYCLFCLLTYAVNIALLLVSARALGCPWPQAVRQAGSALGSLMPSPARPPVGLFWGLVIVGAFGTVAVHAAATFSSRGAMGTIRMQFRELIARQPGISLSVIGDPMIGRPDAKLQIIEFSDFLCPACHRAAKLNTILLANHRRDAAFVFKHFPLDTSCNSTVSRMVHPGACQIAAATECAHLQGKFWPFNDLIMAKGHLYKPADIDGDAARLGLDMPRFRACLSSGEGVEAVKRDIAEAAKAGVSSTPTYLVNGIPLPPVGLLPDMFEEFIAAMREAGR